MKFIRAIRVQDFRSLARVQLEDLDNVVPIVGSNGSGKSNLLRALNLLFNGEVEVGVELDLSRDFHDPTGKRKAKKLIEVALDIDFGSGLRKALQSPIDNLAGGSRVVTIRKRWSLDHVTGGPVEDLALGPQGGTLKMVGDGDRSLVQRLLASVRFRYISNHVHPTDLLRQEEENIRRVLFRRLGKSPSFTQDQIDKIAEAAEALMTSVTTELQASTGRVSKVELIKPSNASAVAWRLGVEKGEVGRRKQALHKLLAKRENSADIAALTALVPWMSGLLRRDDQQLLDV